MKEAYERYDFHSAMRGMARDFCSLDLGGFYLDILKDRLYTCPADSLARRSAQFVLHHIARELCKLLSPMLCFHSRRGVAGFDGGRGGESDAACVGGYSAAAGRGCAANEVGWVSGNSARRGMSRGWLWRKSARRGRLARLWRRR